MFLYIKTNILRGYGIFKNDFAHPREPANVYVWHVHNKEGVHKLSICIIFYLFINLYLIVCEQTYTS